MMTKFGNAKVDKGYYRISSGKEGNHGKLLHRLIFEDYYGITILPGNIVHHKDGDKLNNHIDNLEIMDGKKHISYHNTGRKHSELEKQKMRDNHADFSGKNNPQYGKRGEDNHNWKNYATIVKTGKMNNKQRYGIRFTGKIIKKSINPFKLVDWFNKEYPNEIILIRSIMEE